MTKAEIWQQHITEWQDSGLSQVVFCNQQKINIHNLQYWRRRLAPPAAKPNRLTPVTITRSAPARVHIGSQVSIELSSEHLPNLLLALL
jgi:hypothetical protein